MEGEKTGEKQVAALPVRQSRGLQPPSPPSFLRTPRPLKPQTLQPTTRRRHLDVATVPSFLGGGCKCPHRGGCIQGIPNDQRNVTNDNADSEGLMTWVLAPLLSRLLCAARRNLSWTPRNTDALSLSLIHTHASKRTLPTSQLSPFFHLCHSLISKGLISPSFLPPSLPSFLASILSLAPRWTLSSKGKYDVFLKVQQGSMVTYAFQASAPWRQRSRLRDQALPLSVLDPWPIRPSLSRSLHRRCFSAWFQRGFRVVSAWFQASACPCSRPLACPSLSCPAFSVVLATGGEEGSAQRRGGCAGGPAQ